MTQYTHHKNITKQVMWNSTYVDHWYFSQCENPELEETTTKEFYSNGLKGTKILNNI